MTHNEPRWVLSPVMPLGHIGTTQFVYFIRETRQVVCLTASQHTGTRLLSMASESDWHGYPSVPIQNGQVVWGDLAEDLMAACRSTGMYDPLCVRGCGAWRDGNDIVYHAGTALFVNGTPTDFADYQNTQYRYLAYPGILCPADKAVTLDEVGELITTIQTWAWRDEDISPTLVIGWLACAFICGALGWRPHMWISGRRGSGKSTLDGLISGILGDLVVHVQGSTTEAGLRQALNGDARPVAFDEFEANSVNSKRILDAARSAASDNSAPVIKGTPDGRPLIYRLRFMGLFSGVVANAENAADASRIVFLEIEAKERTEDDRARLVTAFERFDTKFGAHALRRMIDTVVTGHFDQALETYRKAIRLCGGDERKADVYANLLAGAHVLQFDTEVTEANARKLAELVSKLDVDELSDEEECLAHLLGYEVKLDYGYVRSVGEWIEFLVHQTGSGPSTEEVRRGLARLGILVDEKMLKVANSSPGIKGVYDKTRWASGAHSRTLQRLQGAHTGGKARFAGVQSRYTQMPVSDVLNEDET